MGELTLTPLPDSVTSSDEVIALLQLEEGQNPYVYYDAGNAAIGSGFELNAINLPYVLGAMGVPDGDIVAATAAAINAIAIVSIVPANHTETTTNWQSALTAAIQPYLPGAAFTLGQSQRTAALEFIIENVTIPGLNALLNSHGLTYLTTTSGMNTQEYMALLSIYYNAPSVIGPNLLTALEDGNRAQAWFQIRYASNKGWQTGEGGGVAKRRYYESTLFGLSQSGDTLAQAAQVYEMLQENRSTILAYENLYGTNPDAGQGSIEAEQEIQLGNNGAKGAGVSAPLAISTLDTALMPAAVLVSGALNSSFSAVTGGVQIALDSNSTAGAFQVFSSDILLAPDATDIAEGFATDTNTSPDNIEAADDPAANHILLGPMSVDDMFGTAATLTGGTGSDILIAGAGNEILNAGSGSDTLIGGQGIQALDTLASGYGYTGAGNDTLYGGAGTDTFDLSVPVSGSVVETIDPTATQAGAVEVSSFNVTTGGNSVTVLGGGQSTPLQLESENGSEIVWSADGQSDGYQYTFDETNDTLTITNSTAMGGSSIVINSFNLKVAQGSSGYLGIYLLNPGASVAGGSTSNGSDPPAVFPASSLQTYTLDLDTPASSAQTLTVTLSGAPAADFEAVVGGSIESLSGAGALNVTLPAGQSSISIGLLNTTPMGQSGTLVLGASIQNPDNPTGAPLSGTPLSIDYQGASPSGSPVAATLVGANGTPGYFQDVGGNIWLNFPGDTVGAAAGDDWIWAQGVGVWSESVVAGGDDDTILGEFGMPEAPGPEVPTGENVIVATGKQDVIENDAGWYGSNPVGSVAIFGNGVESLATAIATSQTDVGTGQQGDLIVGYSEEATTVVGSDGNDFIANASGNDVVVAGAGDDTILGGVQSIYWERFWDWFGEYEVQNGPPSAALLASYIWSASVSASGQLDVVGIVDEGDEPGQTSIDSSTPYATNPQIPLPPNYEGNTDINGNVFGGGNETIFGGAGASDIFLSNGNNYVNLETGNSSLYGGMGDNTIIAGSGEQQVIAGGGNDYIAGGSGVDTLIGRGGDNTIIGGSGNATIFAGSAGTSGDAGSWATSESGDNYVSGGSGNDLIYGSGGSDTLIGGSGNVTISGGAGSESIVGGAGNDELIGGVGNDTISAGGAGHDSLIANGTSSSTSVLYGGTGTDIIEGGSGANLLFAGDGGTAASPTEVFASQSDSSATSTLYGGLGVDLLEGGSGAAVIYAGDGGTSSAPTSVFAGSGDATLYGGLGTDLISGGSGADVLYAGDGGTTAHPTSVVAGTGAATLLGGAGPAILDDSASGDDLIISATANDTIAGMGADTLVAGTGDDLIQSLGGNVTVQLNAAFGAESIQADGGSYNLSFGSSVASTDFTIAPVIDSSGGLDLIISGQNGSLVAFDTGSIGTLSFSDGTFSVASLISSEADGDQTLLASSGYSSALSVGSDETLATTTEDTIAAFGSNDTILAGASAAVIDSYGDNADITAVEGENSNTIVAQGSNDTVNAPGNASSVTVGGANSLVTGNAEMTATGADDTLVGGTVSQTFVVGNSSDVVQDTSTTTVNTLETSVSYTLPQNVNTLDLTGSAAISGTGNNANDVMEASNANDTLVAGGGIDTLYGGNGNDTFVIDDVADTIAAVSSSTSNVIESSVSYSAPTHVNTLELTGTANLLATANSGNDTLMAVGSGVDTLIGGSGSDVFVVNNASDVVEWGTGADTLESSTNYSAGQNQNYVILTGTGGVVATANSGNDTLGSLASGPVTLTGGAGNDVFIVNSSADVIQDSSSTSSNAVESSTSYTLPDNVNSLTLTGSAAIAGTGNAGADTLTAGTGVDTLVAGAGPATLLGGSGSDTFVLDNAGDVVQDSSTSTSDTIQSSVSYTAPTNVNTLVLTAANLVATANPGADTLVADAAADSLVGGGGDDTFVVSSPDDFVADSTSGATNVLESSVSYSLPTNVNILVLTGSAGIGAVANGANDTLVAGAGADTLTGGAGDDVFVVNSAADVVENSAGNAGSEVESSVSYTQPNNVQTLTLTSTAAITGTANSNDTLVALAVTGSGADTLIGGATTNDFYVDSADDVVMASSAASANIVYASCDYTVPSNVQQLSLTAGGLVATANSSEAVLVGSYNDTLIAGTLADTLSAGGGDLLVVNNVADVVNQEAGGFENDSLQSSVSYTAPAAIDILMLSGSGDLVATANSDNDTLVSNSGIDTLVSGTGNDTFVVDNAADVVQASSGSAENEVQSSVSFTAPTNVDSLVLTGTAALVGTANSGNDTLTSNSGGDTLIGGSGDDTFILNSAGDVVEDSSGTSSNEVISTISYTLPSNVDALLLSGFGSLSGTGNAANDLLEAGGGSDTLVSGSGIDTLIAGGGSDLLVVSNVDDVVQDTVLDQNDTLSSSVSYSAPTNISSLVLTGTANIVGTANGANDTLSVAGVGVDTLVGGAGNDTFIVNSTSDVIQDSAGSSTNVVQASVSYSVPTDVNTLILTGSGDLTGTANSGADTLSDVGTGVATFVGGSGNDVFIIGNSADTIEDTATGSSNVADSAVSYSLPTNVNKLILTGSASISGTGNAASDVLVASSGTDTLYGGSGVDTLTGGSGNDTFVVDSSSDVVQDSSSISTNTLESTVSYSAPTDVNTLVLIGSANITGTANAGVDTLLAGGTGADTLVGRANSDTFVVNNAADVVQDTYASYANTVQSSVSYTAPTDVNTLILVGTGSIIGTGNAAADTLIGGAGNDTLAAGSGADNLIGGSGDTTFVINSTSDVVRDSYSTTANSLQSSVSYALPVNVDALTLTGTAALTATGNTDGVNVLTANSGNDVLAGKAWSNMLNGGAGSDTIDAGPGANLIYSGNGGTSAHPTIVYGNATGTSTVTANTIYGGTGVNVLYGGPGTDVIYAGSGTESVIAGTGYDSLYGAAGATLEDTAGAGDLLSGGSGAETLIGTGTDTLVAGSGPDTLENTAYLGVGMTDAFNEGFGTADVTRLVSNSSLDFGTGIEADTTTIAGSLVGGALSLVMSVSGGGAVTLTGGLNPGLIGNVTFADTGAESLTQLMQAQGPGLQVINDGSSNIEVDSNSDDSLAGGTGNDSLFGYGDADTLSAYFDDPYNEIQTQGIFSFGDNSVINGGYGVDDTLYASGSGSVINAYGYDTVFAYGANDTVNASTGVFGDPSNEPIYILQSSTVVNESATGQNVAIYSSATYTLPTNVESLDLLGAGLVATSNTDGGDLTAQYDYDTLIGGSGQDVLTAEGKYDSLVGGSGNETYVIYDPTDSIEFGSNPNLNTVEPYFDYRGNYSLPTAANNLILGIDNTVGTANGGNDSLTATGSGDTLVGGSGNDTLVGGAVLVGGSGNDTFVVGSSSVVVEDSASGATNIMEVSSFVAGSFTLPTNVNTLLMTGSANLVGTGNAASDSIVGNSAADTLIGGVASDTLVAGSGNDLCEGSESGGDTFVFNAGFGADTIAGAQGGASLEFGVGIAESSLTFSALTGTAGAAPSLVISGDGGSVTVEGGLVAGAISAVDFSGGGSYSIPELMAPSGRVTVTGSEGNLILSPENDDSVVGGSGEDTIDAWGSDDTLGAGAGGTLIYAGGSTDLVQGGSATDTLVGIGADDTLVGGGGNETLLVENSTTVVQATAGVGSDTLLSSVSYTIPTNLQSITLIGSAAVAATANSANDTLIASGAAVDSLIAGPGNDVFVVNNVGDVIEDTSTTTSDIVESPVSFSLPNNVNTLLLTGSAAIAGTANAGADSITANSGADTLTAGLGADTLVAGSGANTLLGGSSNDTFVVDSASDVVKDFASNASNVIESSVSYSLPVNVNELILTGSAALKGTANTASDTLIGGANGDTLVSGAGADTLEGGGASIGTTYVVNNAADVVIGQPGEVGVVQSAVSYSLPTYVDTLELTGTASLVGGANNDASVLVVSNSGHDTLIAGSGNDTLEATVSGTQTMIAGSGDDLLQSGTGSTTLFVLNTGFGSDTVSSSGTATLEFGAGISPSDLTVEATTDGNGKAALLISDGTGSVLLGAALAGEAYQFNFNGGGALTLAQFLAQATTETSSVAGASGNIVLEGTASAALTGGTGNDTLYAGAVSDTITGGSGNQVLDALSTDDSVVGGSASDTLTGLGSNDTLMAGAAVDTLIGGTAASVVFVINSTSDAIQLQTSPGADTVESSVTYSLPTNVNTLILTGTAALKGTANTGADTLTANSGLDTLVGSTGSDTFVINSASDVVQDSSGSASNTIESAVSYSLPTDVNNLTLIGTAALTGYANSATDTLTSNSGIDTLIGGSGKETFVVNNAADIVQDTSSSMANTIQTPFSYSLPTDVNTLVLTGTGNVAGLANTGSDTLNSNSGIDTLTGGSGSDTFIINDTADVVQDTSTTASNVMQASVSYSLPANVNTLTLTGSANLIGTANSGNDTLTSNTGIDTITGGAGNDTFIVSNAADIVQDTSSTASNVIKSSVSFTLPTDVNTLTLTGSAAIAGTGNAGNDSLTANSGTDTLVAGSGTDTLVAGTAVDTLIGGSGNDTFVINKVGDVVEDSSSSAMNTISSSVSYSLPADVNALVLTGGTALTGTANAGNDTLTSNSAADTLIGAGGNDTFVVSNANDVIEDTSFWANNNILSTVSFTLPTNIDALTFTGASALRATGNAANDLLTANTGADTLIAGSGVDTLVSGSTGADSLVGGTGNDLFVVNYASDVVNVGSTYGVDTIEAAVSYTASANVADLTLIGTSNLAGTGNSASNVITANSGTDTLTAGSGIATLIGGTGNDIFVVNNSSDIVSDSSSTASNTIKSSVGYTLPTDVNTLTLTGTVGLLAAANSGNDSLSANTGSDTLVAGAGTDTLVSGTSGTDSLVGGSGNDTFVINNVADVVNDASSTATNTIESTVSYTLPTNVNNLIFTGTSALEGVGNAADDSITANTGRDTLVAGSGTDTLISGTGIDSLVGGSGSDIFVVNNASDVVSVSASGTNDTIQSSVNYTLPTNLQYLTLTGTAALTGTGNALTDLIVGNSGNDTLTGGTGVAVLEGGKSAGSDLLRASSNQAALIAGVASSTLTGGAYKDFYAAGTVADSITTGATANVVAANDGDGATTLQPTSGASDVLSLGAGIDTESLSFTKSGNNLVLTDGVGGDSITFANWYAGSSDQDVATLQVVEIASASYNSDGSDPLRNEALEEFNFATLVSEFNTAGSPSDWALSNGMPSAQLSGSSAAAYGGDLAYYFGLNGNLTGMDLSAAQSTLTNGSYATAAQTIDSWSSISGSGGALQLLARPSGGAGESASDPGSSEANSPDVAVSQDADSTASSATWSLGNSIGPSLPPPDVTWSPIATMPFVTPATLSDIEPSSTGSGAHALIPLIGTQAAQTPGASEESVAAASDVTSPRSSVGPALKGGTQTWVPIARIAVATAEPAARSAQSSDPVCGASLQGGTHKNAPIPVASRPVDPYNLAWLALDSRMYAVSDMDVAEGSFDLEGETSSPIALLAGAEDSPLHRTLSKSQSSQDGIR